MYCDIVAGTKKQSVTISKLSKNDDSTTGTHNIFGNGDYCCEIEEPRESPPSIIPIAHGDYEDYNVVPGDSVFSLESDEDAWIKALDYDHDDEGAVTDDE